MEITLNSSFCSYMQDPLNNLRTKAQFNSGCALTIKRSVDNMVSAGDTNPTLQQLALRATEICKKAALLEDEINHSNEVSPQLIERVFAAKDEIATLKGHVSAYCEPFQQPMHAKNRHCVIL